MKRQSEELIFKYEATPILKDTNGILFVLPPEYDPIAGDNIELFASENVQNGQLSYYANLVCFQYKTENNGYSKEIATLGGKIEVESSEYAPLAGSYLDLYENNRAVVLYIKAGSKYPPFIPGAENQCIVNIIVHRSKAKIDLYS